jgi:hypothetical protein
VQCEVENPPLGEGAPAGYRNLYLRDFATGKYTPLITTANSPALSVEPQDFELELAGASPDLRHAAISTCAALTAGAVEVPDLSGCDPAFPNLYKWSEGALEPVNTPPGGGATVPGAQLAAPAGAISNDGSRVYWRGADANLYLRDGAQTIQVDADAGGEGEFQVASADGAIAYFTKEGHLYRFVVAAEAATDLTPSGEVQGALGASSDGSRLYYLAVSGLFLWQDGTTTKVAAGADPSNLPAATGTARVSADANRLAFLSAASLTGYPNDGHSEVFVYDAHANKLLCASCNPKGTAAKGPSSIPAAIAAGDGPAAYKPRALSADGARLFFDSEDVIVSGDTDKAADVYQWQAKGSGACTRVAGCIGLVSSGRIGASSFADASSDGTDAFFLTAASLLPGDPGSVDLYDARSGGGFPEAPTPIPCVGDACQGPPSVPEDTAPATAHFIGRGNPVPPRARKPHCRKKQRLKRGHCVKRARKGKHPPRKGARR